MKTLFCVLVMLACESQLVGQSSEGLEGSAGEPLKMARYQIIQFFDVDFEANNGKVKYAKVSTAAPGVQKKGVRVGAQLISIGGKPIAGMEVAAFKALIETPPLPGEKNVFVFTRKHGFLGRKTGTVTLESENTSKEPNKAPEPTTTSVTPPAAQEPRQP